MANSTPGAGSLVLRVVLCVPIVVVVSLLPRVADRMRADARQHFAPVSGLIWVLPIVALVFLAAAILLPLGWWARTQRSSRVLVWPQRVAAAGQLMWGALAVFAAGSLVAAGPHAYGPAIVLTPVAVSLPFLAAWILFTDSRSRGTRPGASPNVAGGAGGEQSADGVDTGPLVGR